MSGFTKAVWIFMLLLTLSCIPNKHILKKNYFLIDDNCKTMVIAHGGGQGLFPANTMRAFDGSVEIGVDALEMDIRISKDNILVTHHDETIDRLSNGKGKISDFSFEELQNYNYGYNFVDIHGERPYQDSLINVPALSKVFQKYSKSFMIVEIKDEGERGKMVARELNELIIQYNMQDRIIVASFHHKILKYFYRISNGEIPTSSSVKESAKFVIFSKLLLNRLFFTKSTALHLPSKVKGVELATQRIVNSAHQKNIAIHYWTINDKEEMKSLIEMNVDGIITDRPDLMIELLEEMGQK